MEIGIIGLPQSGKTSIFNALTGLGGAGQGGHGDRAAVGVAKVPDSRLQPLSELFNSRKIVQAEVKYFDVPLTPRGLGKGEGFGGKLLNVLSQADALLHVVRAFDDESIPHMEESVDPLRDIEVLNLELTYSDLTILERKRERLEDALKGARAQERDNLLGEQALIDRVKEKLEEGLPLRSQELSTDEQKALSGYQFLTAKPELILLNVGEDDLDSTDALERQVIERFGGESVGVASVCGKLEEELAQLDAEEAGEFRVSMNGGEPALDKVLRVSYELLGLVSFLTVGPDETRAWPVGRGTAAVKAAGKIHSDIERGFIRAEVIGYEEVLECKGLVEARKKGLIRQEGKEYRVQDGDVINFLFNV